MGSSAYRDATRLDQFPSRQPQVDGQDYAEFRAGLLRHIGIEEKLLLPAARRARSGTPIERAHQLRIEHGAIGLLKTVYAECERLIGAETSLALSVSAHRRAAARVKALGSRTHGKQEHWFRARPRSFWVSHAASCGKVRCTLPLETHMHVPALHERMQLYVGHTRLDMQDAVPVPALHSPPALGVSRRPLRQL